MIPSSRRIISILPQLLLLVLVFASSNLVGAQETPSIDIPTFANDTSLRVRQNVCDRFRAYDRGEVELRLALEGLALRPLFTKESFFHLDENGKLNEDYPGMIAKIMDELGKRAGFTWRESFGVTEGPGDTGKTWTDLLLWGTDYYDVYADWYARTIDRLKLGVTFPEGFYDSSFMLVGVEQDKKDSSIDLWQWLEPFDPEVWILIVVTILFSGVLYQLLDYIPPNHVNRYKTPTFNTYRRQQRRQSDASIASESTKRRISATDAKEAVYEGAHTMGDGIFLSSLLFTQHFQFMPRTTAARVFSASMALWALLISSNYTANLASFFVIENTPTLAVQSLDDAIQTGQPVCVWRGTAGHEWLVKEHPKAKLLETAGEMALYEAVRNGDCVVGVTGVSSYERMETLQESNPDCNLRWVGRVLKFVPAGFSVKADAGNLCSSLINDVLNLHLMEMESDGFIEQVWKAELARNQDQDCSKQNLQGSGDGESRSRSLKEMAGTFVIHFAFGGVAILVAVVSRLYDRYKRMSDDSRRQVFESLRRPTDFQAARKETLAALEREESTNHDDVIHNTKAYMEKDSKYRPESPKAYREESPMEERLEMMEQTFRQRQDELEMTVREQMDTIVALLREKSSNKMTVADVAWT